MVAVIHLKYEPNRSSYDLVAHLAHEAAHARMEFLIENGFLDDISELMLSPEYDPTRPFGELKNQVLAGMLARM